MTKKSVSWHMDDVNSSGFSGKENLKAFKANRKLMRNLMRKAVSNKGLRWAWNRFQEKRYSI